MIKGKDLKALVIEKENIKLYFDFKKLVKSHLDHPKCLVDYNDKETLDILNNKGYIILYKYQNIIIASALLKPYKYKTYNGYLISPILIFEDVRDESICNYIINNNNVLIKDLGFEYSFLMIHPKDIFLENVSKILDYNLLETINYKNLNYHLYYKDIE